MLDLKTEQPQDGPVLENVGGYWRTKGDLGPHQIEWLAKNVYQFGPAKRQADRAITHAAEVASRIEGGQT